tara:strand:- start:3982 stop:4695 length:714 start_codon:yes stop_codon:yes gene_type:complete
MMDEEEVKKEVAHDEQDKDALKSKKNDEKVYSDQENNNFIENEELDQIEDGGPWDPRSGSGQGDGSEIKPSPEEQLAEIKDQLLRAMAENENLRRRTKRELEETSKYAIAGFAREILSVADNLRRALESLDGANKGDSKENSQSLFEGVELTEKELISILSRYGIKKVDPKGGKFDAKLHQAMFEVESESCEPGTIVEVVQEGYMIGERLLRPAMVGVAKKLKVVDSDSLASNSEKD